MDILEQIKIMKKSPLYYVPLSKTTRSLKK